MDTTIQLFGKDIGVVNGSKFVTFRRREHFFRKFGGFGLSCAILRQIKARGVSEVVFIYDRVDGSQSAYACPVEVFYDKGEPWTDKVADLQLIVNLKHMRPIG